MYKSFMSQLLPTLIVPIGIALILIPFSLLIGWNMATITLFWFILTPALAEYLPTLVSTRKNLLAQSLIGMLVSYALVVFMIYDHYRTDMFFMIMISCGFNLAVITVISRIKKVISAERQNAELL